MSVAQTGRVFTEEHRRKLSEARRGKKASAETLARMSAAQRRRHAAEVTARG